MNTEFINNLLAEATEGCSLVCTLRSWAGLLAVLAVGLHLVLWPVRRFTRKQLDLAAEKDRMLRPLKEELHSRHRDDPAAYQRELLQLYQEHRYNPFAGTIGCLPVLVEIPFWIVLGVYLSSLKDNPGEVLLPGWFGSVARPDLFRPFPWVDGWPIPFKLPLLGLTEGFNLLPVLVTLIFLLRYWWQSLQVGIPETKTTNPPIPDEEGENAPVRPTSKRKGVHWGRVAFALVFLVLIYNAPCGLTYFMLVSSLVGFIVESRPGYGNINSLK